MILPIITYNNISLRNKCSDIINFDLSNYNKLINNMLDTMYNAKGIGLSANQIGVNINLFIIDIHRKYNTDIVDKIFINPKIIKIYGDYKKHLEGCLSIPSILEYINRKSHIILQYTDINNNVHVKKFNNLQARVIQHEYDHTKGILFIDHLSEIKKKLLKNKLKKIDRGYVKTPYPIHK